MLGSDDFDVQTARPYLGIAPSNLVTNLTVRSTLAPRWTVPTGDIKQATFRFHIDISEM